MARDPLGNVSEETLVVKLGSFCIINLVFDVFVSESGRLGQDG